jgi:CelD/BcsL family acetyltransferase involved in cellulose biosynthesis
MQGDELSLASELTLAAEWDDSLRAARATILHRPINGPTPPGASSPSRVARQLQCLSLYGQGRLVVVWPLAVERGGKLRIVRPLGTEGSEYSAPLVEPGTDLAACTRLLWSAATKLGDLVVLRTFAHTRRWPAS